MQLTDIPWPWLGAAAILVIFVVLLVASKFLRRSSKPAPAVTASDQQESWTPTGRIDFAELGGGFALHAEDTRVTNGKVGVEHRELRWRRATLEEAKAVTVAYHAQRSLVMTPSYLVRSSGIVRQQNSDVISEHRDAQPDKESASENVTVANAADAP